jgi:hypothetical protein
LISQPARRPLLSSPLVVDGIGYIGAVILLVAALVVRSSTWPVMAIWTRVMVLASLATLLWSAGWWAVKDPVPILNRVGTVVWLLSVAAVAFLLAVLSTDVLLVSAKARFAVVATGSSVYSASLYRLRPRRLLVPLLAAGLCVAPLGILVWLGLSLAGLFGASMWVAGAATILLGWRGILQDQRSAYVLGALGVLVGPAVTLSFHWASLLGAGTGLALLGGAVALRSSWLLGLGAVGVFAYSPVAASTYFAGRPLDIALFISGVFAAALAVIARHLLQLARSLRERDGQVPTRPDGSSTLTRQA